MATYYVDTALGNDGNPGTSPGAGNAWATLTHAGVTAAAGDKVWVIASGTYAEKPAFSTNAGTSSTPIVYEGYTATTGDGGQVTITGSGVRTGCIALTKGYHTFKNFIFTSPTAQCIESAVTNIPGVAFYNCQFTKGSGTPTSAIGSGVYLIYVNIRFIKCLFNGFSNRAISQCAPVFIDGCRIADNTGDGIHMLGYQGGLYITNSIISRNVNGIITDGATGPATIIRNCVIENNSGDGITLTLNGNGLMYIANNIIANQTGVGKAGLRLGTYTDPNPVWCDYNFYYNNTTNTVGNNSAGDHDVFLSGNPFNNASGSDWTLNATGGAGATCRAGAFPGQIDATNIGYLDAGALQHQDPPSTGCYVPFPSGQIMGV